MINLEFIQLDRLMKKRFRRIDEYGSRLIGHMSKLAPMVKSRKRWLKEQLNENRLARYEIPLFLTIGIPPDKAIDLIVESYPRAVFLAFEVETKMAVRLEKDLREFRPGSYITEDFKWKSEIMREQAYKLIAYEWDGYHQRLTYRPHGRISVVKRTNRKRLAA
jgi:hypothetical protein